MEYDSRQIFGGLDEKAELLGSSLRKLALDIEPRVISENPKTGEFEIKLPKGKTLELDSIPICGLRALGTNPACQFFSSEKASWARFEFSAEVDLSAMSKGEEFKEGSPPLRLSPPLEFRVSNPEYSPY